MNLIVHGYAKTSRELVKILSEKKEKFLVVANNQIELEMAKDDGLEVNLLDLSFDKNLLEIGISKDIKTLFCMDNDYNKNLFVTLAARNLDKELNIISLVTTINDEKKMILAGATHVVNPYDFGSHRIYRLIRKPMVFDVLDSMIFLNHDIKISEILVPSGSSIIDTEFQKLTIEKDYDLVLIGVESGKNSKFHYNTKRIYKKIREQDIFVVAGSQKNIDKLKKGLKS
jgi:voltage-gated potassium channel